MGSTPPNVRDPVDFYLDHDGQGFYVVRHAAQDRPVATAPSGWRGEN